MDESVWSAGEMIMTGEILAKLLLPFPFPHVPHGLNGLGLEPGFRDDSPITNRLSHDRFFIEFMYVTITTTYSMVQSPTWEANWFADSQEIPRISRNPKVHYRTYKRPPPVSILGQPNPVHIPTSHLLEIHPNIIHPSTPMSPQ